MKIKIRKILISHTVKGLARGYPKQKRVKHRWTFFMKRTTPKHKPIAMAYERLYVKSYMTKLEAFSYTVKKFKKRNIEVVWKM